jgi:hypothetical protein
MELPQSKLSLFKHHAVKMYVGREAIILRAFLSLALDGGQWSTSRLRRFTSPPRKMSTTPIGYEAR